MLAGKACEHPFGGGRVDVLVGGSMRASVLAGGKHSSMLFGGESIQAFILVGRKHASRRLAG